MRIRTSLASFALFCSLACAQTATPSDAELWKGFAAFTESLPPLPPGQAVSLRERYVSAMSAQGVAAEEAGRRFERINVLRRETPDREKVYWNGAFKSGGGPSSPLRLLQEALYKVKPGRALDAGMGRGRNTIFLAATGWDATGYDMSPDALQVAQTAARAAGVKFTTVESKHDDFAFGENQWDLILCAYCYLLPGDTKWPAIFRKALKPGGLVVFQTSVGGAPSWRGLSENWSAFHILRLEDLDAGAVDDDWTPSRTYRTVRLIVRKE